MSGSHYYDAMSVSALQALKAEAEKVKADETSATDTQAYAAILIEQIDAALERKAVPQ